MDTQRGGALTDFWELRSSFGYSDNATMYHLLKGLHEYLTRSESRSRLPPTRSRPHALVHRKDEFSVIIIGLDGAGKSVRMANFIGLHLHKLN
jgi:hypothetical protein